MLQKGGGGEKGVEKHNSSFPWLACPPSFFSQLVFQILFSRAPGWQPKDPLRQSVTFQLAAAFPAPESLAEQGGRGEAGCLLRQPAVPSQRKRDFRHMARALLPGAHGWRCFQTASALGSRRLLSAHRSPQYPYFPRAGRRGGGEERGALSHHQKPVLPLPLPLRPSPLLRACARAQAPLPFETPGSLGQIQVARQGKFSASQKRPAAFEGKEHGRAPPGCRPPSGWSRAQQRDQTPDAARSSHPGEGSTKDF